MVAHLVLVRSMPHEKFAVGDRVRVSQDYHWAQGARAKIVEHSWPDLPSGECFRRVPSLQGLLRFYWVQFDEPQRDTEGDLYSGGEIDDRYIVADSKT